MARAGTPALIGWLLAGALIRAAALPLAGSADVDTWKLWSFVGATDATGFYGVGGAPPERRVLKWRDQQGTTEYLPLSLYELAVVGRIYARIDPLYADSTTLTVLVKMPALIAEIALIAFLLTAGRRWLGDRAAEVAALAIWLNPAMILNGAALGYLDIQMASLATIAVVAALHGRAGLAGTLVAAAVLTKPQAVFAVPFVLIAVARQPAPLRRLVRCTAAGVVTASAILAPIVLRGAWPNMIQAVRRLNAHDMLSGEATNAWWIVTWLLRVVDGASDSGWWDALTQPVRILSITRFSELGYPSARLIGTTIVMAAVVWAAVRAWRVRSDAALVLAAAWTVFAYATFQVQVHENHLLLAVPLAAIAASLDRRLTGVMAGISAIAALNMYLFQGIGGGWQPIPMWTPKFVDTSVILAGAAIVVFLDATRRLAQVSVR
ncbi:MAG TPA: hypothetical protein VFV98_06735 [Vicinamibacterales bacterium]|nr:hypothetical protein [Vicinamibacterales bacterium]